MEDYTVSETSVLPTSHFSLPALFSRCAGIGYSMFSHGNLSRALEMKTPPPLNLGTENMRGDAGNPGMVGTRSNLSSAVRISTAYKMMAFD